MNVAGTLQINQNGFFGGAGTYSYDQSNGTLIYNNTTGPYGPVDGSHPYWPASNGPQNVNVVGAGGISLAVARSVNGLFQYAAGVSGAGNLTLNGTAQVNNGGFTSGSPTYGSSSLLRYNTGGTYGRNGEWLPNTTSGAGYPANVQLGNNTTLNLANGSPNTPFQMAGSLTIDAGSTMQLAGSTPLTQPLTILGAVNIDGTLTLSTQLGGDLNVGGNWTRNATTGSFVANNRAVTFNGTSQQTIQAGTSPAQENFGYLIINNPAGVKLLSFVNVLA
ncbi:MAG TPA: hypothetical protein VF525_09625, partial [Pyrinomonadaceae bacterium]